MTIVLTKLRPRFNIKELQKSTQKVVSTNYTFFSTQTSHTSHNNSIQNNSQSNHHDYYHQDKKHSDPTNPLDRSYYRDHGATEEDAEQLTSFLIGKKKLIIITGAGVSTESGIPDYRSPNGAYSKGYKPVIYQDYIKKQFHRQRYWARSMFNWVNFSSTKPNNCHISIAEIEKLIGVQRVVTQNVDGLHQKAGSELVTELHGNLHTVNCSGCNLKISRNQMQHMLKELNLDFGLNTKSKEHPDETTQRPDGDRDLDINHDKYHEFNVPDCPSCGGILRPSIVFFGENVPKDVVEQVYESVSNADGILAIGTSLMVYSVYRFIDHASKKDIPVAIANIGQTRGDHVATLKVEAKLGKLLPMTAKLLSELKK